MLTKARMRVAMILALGLGACSDKDGGGAAPSATGGAGGSPSQTFQPAEWDPSVAPPVVRRHLPLSYIGKPEFGESQQVQLVDFLGTLPEGCELERGTSKWVPQKRKDESKDREPDGTEILAIQKGNNLLTIPLQIDPAQVNQVAITFSNVGKVDLSVEMRRGNARPIKTPLRRYEATGKLRTILVDLPGILAERKAFTAISLSLPFVQRDFRLRSVATVSSPISLRLPTPKAPRPVTTGEESRPAVGLSELGPVRANFTPEPGDQLEFDLARPLSVLDPHTRVGVRVTLKQKGKRASEVIFLEPTKGVSPWATHRMDCTDFAGKPTRAEFEVLTNEKKGTPLCALGIPRLVKPVENGACVVLVTSDTHRGDHVGYLGDKLVVNTPFLNSLAEGGTAFADCWASTNITNPSHISLMTAMLPRDTGVIDNITVMGASANTLAERFSQAGFATYAATSASHMRPDQSGLHQGFDRINVPSLSQRDSVETIEVLKAWLDDTPPGPLFVWLHIFDAHGPYKPPAEFLEPYWDDSKDPRDTSLAELEPEMRAPWDLEVRDLDYIRANYKGEVSYLDQQLEKALAHPRLAGSVAAITSDHGESLGNKGVFFEHQMLFPDTLSVPLVFTGPGVPAGKRVQQPVQQIDVGRTLLNLAGLRETDFPGIDLLLLDDTEDSGPRFSIGSHGLGAGLQLGRYYLLLSLRDHRRGVATARTLKHTTELYDLSADPTCQTDISKDQPKVTAQLRASLVKWLTEAPAQTFAQGASAQDTSRIAQLEALGYAAGGGGGSEDWFEADCECERCEPFQ